MLSLLRRAKSLYLRLKPQSAYSRNVLKLAGGTAGSQVIAVAAIPILTRLYGPESFGMLATFASILALLNVVSSLRYELAIAVPEDDEEAVKLVWLCFALVAISTGLTALGVLLIGDQLADLLHQPSLKPMLWLLPVGILLTGVYQPLSYWSIRRKQFGLLAKTKVLQSIFAFVSNIVFFPYGAIGLTIGPVASASVGTFQILGIKSNTSLRLPFSRPSETAVKFFSRSTLRLIARYSNISFYNSIAGIANSLYPFLYAATLSAAGIIESLGLLFLAKKLIDSPSSLISKSLGDVFLSEIARAREVELKAICLKYMKKISLLAACTLLLYSLFLILFGDKIFGSIWNSQIKIYLLCLVPSSIVQITVGSTGMVFVTSERNSHGLFAQIGMLCSRLLPIALLLYSGGSTKMLPELVCLGLFLGYLFYGGVLIKSISKIKSPS